MKRFFLSCILVFAICFSLACSACCPSSPISFQNFQIEAMEAENVESFSVYGNSISTYEGYIPSDYYTWFTPAKMKVEETWWYQVGEQMSWELCNNSSWSGSRVAYDKDWDYKSYFISPYRLNNLSANGVPNNILVLAGVNDWRWKISPLGTIEGTDSTDFCGAYNLMLNRLIQRYPQARIYCISILPIRENGNTENTVNSKGWCISDANECIKQICISKGVSFINMRDCDFCKDVSAYTEDGLHPNVEGMKLLADFIVEKLKDLRANNTTSVSNVHVLYNNRDIYSINGAIMKSFSKSLIFIKNDKDGMYKKYLTK